MNYSDYYLLCRDVWPHPAPPVETIYEDPVVRIPIESFDKSYIENVLSLSAGVKKDFDLMPADPVMTKHINLWKYADEIHTICDALVPYLEEKRFGCHLYVDKIYIYRTAKLEAPKSSYLWHYDNNPAEIVKNIIYLTDVTELNSPFEYMTNPHGRGIIFPPSRRGTKMWLAAPNGSRLTEGQLQELVQQGCAPQKVTGKIGETYSFSNDAIHRANSIVEGYRDVINIRVKPTLEKAPSYASRAYTTGFDVPGSVNPNPEVAWRAIK